MNLFVYGTLLDDSLVHQLTGRRYDRHPAVLVGYRKVEVSDGYPYIVRDPAGRVDGFMLTGIDNDALATLDAYEDEGSLYRRTEVAVVVSGRQVGAATYVGLAVTAGSQIADRNGFSA